MQIQFTNAGPNAVNFTIETRFFNHDILMQAMVEYAHVADSTLRFSFDEYTGQGSAIVGKGILVGSFQVWPVIPTTKGGDLIAR